MPLFTCPPSAGGSSTQGTGLVTDVTTMGQAPIVTRIADAASACDRQRKILTDALETRNRLMVDAVDQGVSIRTVAKAADLSHPAVVRVLATPHAWLPDVAEH